MDADFKAFFERRTGVPYPGTSAELFHVVMNRLVDVIAAWCDELKKELDDRKC